MQTGLPKKIAAPPASDPKKRSWTTGFFKEKVNGPLRLGKSNLDGDGQADLTNHGGPDKAVNVYPEEHYDFWQRELELSGFSAGAFGENFTTRGLMEDSVCIGDIYQVGEALVQVSQPRQPCWKISRRWGIDDLARQVQETGRTGWYFRVLQEGNVESGQTLALMKRPCPEWTITRANEIMHHSSADKDLIRQLSQCPELSESWRKTLIARLDKRDEKSASQRMTEPQDRQS